MNRDALRSQTVRDYVAASFAAILGHNRYAATDLRLELCQVTHYDADVLQVADELRNICEQTPAVAYRPFAADRQAFKHYLTNPPAYMKFATRKRPHPWDKTPDFSRWD